MPIFEKSKWVKSDFSRNYRDAADIFLPFRLQFIDTAIFFYEYFISKNRKAKVLDLGCGDGFFIQELLKSFSPEAVTLIDGSQEMLNAAKKRLKKHTHIRFIQTSFQDLLGNDLLKEQFDFIHSSLAIHHITLNEKKKLYTYIYNHLIDQGYFLHYDVVISPTETLEKCYLSLWKEWIHLQSISNNREAFLNIPLQYKTNPDNTPDSLKTQLEMLQEIGFQNVDCFSKYGLFALFGGSK